MSSLIDKTLSIISASLVDHSRPAIYFSGGKDSMVLLHILTNEAKLKPDVIFHREPFDLHKFEFGMKVLADTGLTAFDYAPSGVAMWEGQEIMAWINFYQIGERADGSPSLLALPKNIIEPDYQPGHSWLCGRDAFFRKPLGNFRFPWDLVFHGHKNCDSDQIMGDVPLKVDILPNTDGTGPSCAFPLRHWSHDDIWDYTRDHNLPVDNGRYHNRGEWPEKRHNSDYYKACIRCVDRREGEVVVCPKSGLEIPNISSKIAYHDLKLPYIG